MQSPNWTTLMKEGAVSSVGVSPTVSIPQWTRNPFSEFLYTTTGSACDLPLGKHKESIFDIENIDFAQDTMGVKDDDVFLLVPISKDLTREARSVIRSIENKTVAKEAEKLLLIIRNQLGQFDGFKDTPSFWATEGDDQSLLIEWAFSDFRLAFNIEPEIAKSSWALVTSLETGGIYARGSLNFVNIISLLNWLIYFVRVNIGKQQ
jgi:hypothetical protein